LRHPEEVGLGCVGGRIPLSFTSLTGRRYNGG
jgi:hypothetical protein